MLRRVLRPAEFVKKPADARADNADLDAMVHNISKTGQVWFVAL